MVAAEFWPPWLDRTPMWPNTRPRLLVKAEIGKLEFLNILTGYNIKTFIDWTICLLKYKVCMTLRFFVRYRYYIMLIINYFLPTYSMMEFWFLLKLVSDIPACQMKTYVIIHPQTSIRYFSIRLPHPVWYFLPQLSYPPGGYGTAGTCWGPQTWVCPRIHHIC